MDKVTHTIDIKVGVDYSVLFSPENVNGVKLMLNAKSDEELISLYAADVINKINNVLTGQFSEVLTAEINPVQANVEEADYSETENIEDNEEVWTEEISESDIIEDIFDLVKEPTIIEPENIMEDNEEINKSIKLLDIINDKLFRIISYMGKEIEVFIKGMNDSPIKFEEQLRDQQCEVFDMQFIVDELSDPEADYIISYEKADGKEEIVKGKIEEKTEGVV